MKPSFRLEVDEVTQTLKAVTRRPTRHQDGKRSHYHVRVLSSDARRVCLGAGLIAIWSREPLGSASGREERKASAAKCNLQPLMGAGTEPLEGHGTLGAIAKSRS